MLRWIKQQFSTIKPAPAVLDHVPVSGAFVDLDGNRCTYEKAKAVGEGLSHREKLALAAQRFGQSFKCAADDVPHVINRVDGTITDTSDLVADIDKAQEMAAAEDAVRRRAASPPNVRPIARTSRGTQQ